MRYAEPIRNHIDRRREAFAALSEIVVFDISGTLYNQVRCVAEHERTLEARGFRITENAVADPDCSGHAAAT